MLCSCPLSHQKGREGAWFCRAFSLSLLSALPSLNCEVNLTKVNSKVLRSSQLVSAREGRNSVLWAAALWGTSGPVPVCPRGWVVLNAL